MNMKERDKLIIDNQKEDRILLFIFSPLIAVVLGGLAYFLHKWQPYGQVEKVAKFLLFEIFFTFFIFSFVCFLWAIFGQERINKLLLISFSKAKLAIQVLYFGTLLTFVYFYFQIYF
ncbi:MAG: hypothetical protein KJ826_18765 [Proteobacteria bacterium]|nr:hypothetical protein [Pseudomonadota bacterium]MBU4035008.1 hypothetical protein [Pseudomonadota bacterium]